MERLGLWGPFRPSRSRKSLYSVLLALTLHVLSYYTTQLAWLITLLVTSLLLDGNGSASGDLFGL